MVRTLLLAVGAFSAASASAQKLIEDSRPSAPLDLPACASKHSTTVASGPPVFIKSCPTAPDFLQVASGLAGVHQQVKDGPPVILSKTIDEIAADQTALLNNAGALPATARVSGGPPLEITDTAATAATSTRASDLAAAGFKASAKKVSEGPPLVRK